MIIEHACLWLAQSHWFRMVVANLFGAHIDYLLVRDLLKLGGFTKNQ
jgi:hypothetical protein